MSKNTVTGPQKDHTLHVVSARASYPTSLERHLGRGASCLSRLATREATQPRLDCSRYGLTACNGTASPPSTASTAEPLCGGPPKASSRYSRAGELRTPTPTSTTFQGLPGATLPQPRRAQPRTSQRPQPSTAQRKWSCSATAFALATARPPLNGSGRVLTSNATLPHRSTEVGGHRTGRRPIPYLKP